MNFIVTCAGCGVEISRTKREIARAKEFFCNKSCKGLKNGGSRVNDKGYRVIRLGPGNYVLEHRWVVEQHIGRKLLPSEHVHHINGDRLDNRLSNLEVLSRNAHQAAHNPKLISPDSIKTFAGKDLATKQIGNLLGVSAGTVSTALKEYGVLNGRLRNLAHIRSVPIASVVELYRSLGNFSAVARRVGFSRQTVERILRREGIV